MRFIEKEQELRLLRIAYLGKLLEQLVGREHIDDSASVPVGAEEIGKIQCRLAEERVGALVFEHEQLSLHRPDRRGRDVAIGLLQLGGMVGDQTENRAQILEIEQRKPLLIGNAERDIENAFLSVVELQEPRQQQWSHLRDGRADGMSLLAKNVPENHRVLVRLIGES